MSRLNACLIALALLLAVSVPLAAQANPDGTASAPYVVKQGENLWMLAGAKMGDPFLWEKIYQMNPFLREPGRRYVRNGMVYVLVRPGEKLYGLEKLGIVPSFADLNSLNLIVAGQVVEREIVPDWFWWVLAILAALAIIAWLIYRMLKRDAATARPAMVRGGVTRETAEAPFQRQAARLYENRTGQLAEHQSFQIVPGSLTPGRIWGVLNVRYADKREVPRRLNGDRAYRASVRFPSGTTEELYMLQACGNDLRYGGISRYLPGPEFRFEEDTQQAPSTEQTTQRAAEPETAPAAEQAPAPVAEQPEAPRVMAAAAGAGTASVANAAQPGAWTLEYKPEEAGKDTMVRITGVDVDEFKFTSNQNETVFRFKKVKKDSNEQ